jgi:hypothetical protein
LVGTNFDVSRIKPTDNAITIILGKSLNFKEEVVVKTKEHLEKGVTDVSIRFYDQSDIKDDFPLVDLIKKA